VIEAGTVVSQDVPPFAIVCRESPGKVQFRFPPEVIREIQKSPWWDKELRDLMARTDAFKHPLA